jgi:hypothetical protein
MRSNRGVSRVSLCLVAALLGALVAGIVTSLLNSPSYASTGTIQAVPVAGTGDPDRVIATQVAVVQSRTVREEVAAAVGLEETFDLTAAQLRLSNIVTIQATSHDPEVAQQAATAAVQAYTARAGAAEPLQVAVTPLDPPGVAALVGQPRRDVTLAAAGGAVAGISIVLFALTVWPRVRASYIGDVFDAVVLELPHPRRDRSPKNAELESELRRMIDHLAIVASERDADVALSLVPLPGISRSATAWVRRTVAENGGPPAIKSEPGYLGGAENSPPRGTEAVAPRAAAMLVEEIGVPQALAGLGSVSVILARAWVSGERALRKEILSRRAVSEVVVIVMGASRPAIIIPSSDRVASLHASGNGSRRFWRSGETVVWR